MKKLNIINIFLIFFRLFCFLYSQVDVLSQLLEQQRSLNSIQNNMNHNIDNDNNDIENQSKKSKSNGKKKNHQKSFFLMLFL